MAGNSDVYHFDAQKYPHASTQWYNNMHTNLPKFYPFKISSILYFLPIFFKYSIVDSCNVLMYAANCVTSIKLYTQPNNKFSFFMH